MKLGTLTNYFTESFKNRIETRIIINISKNERVCRKSKPKKHREQDWDGTLATRLNKSLPHNNPT